MKLQPRRSAATLATSCPGDAAAWNVPARFLRNK